MKTNFEEISPQKSKQTERPMTTEEKIILADSPQTRLECTMATMDCIQKGQIQYLNPINDLLNEAFTNTFQRISEADGMSIFVPSNENVSLLDNQRVMLTDKNLIKHPHLVNMNAKDFEELCLRSTVSQLSKEIIYNQSTSPEKNPQNAKLQNTLESLSIPQNGSNFSIDPKDEAKIKNIVKENFTTWCPDFQGQCMQLPNYPLDSSAKPLSSFDKYSILNFAEYGITYDITNENIKNAIIEDQKSANQLLEKVNKSANNSNAIPQVNIHGDKDEIKKPTLDLSEHTSLTNDSNGVSDRIQTLLARKTTIQGKTAQANEPSHLNNLRCSQPSEHKRSSSNIETSRQSSFVTPKRLVKEI